MRQQLLGVQTLVRSIHGFTQQKALLRKAFQEIRYGAMRLLSALLLLLPACAAPGGDSGKEDGLNSRPIAAEPVAFRVLGLAQDAGLPHIGCDCANCSRVRRENRTVRVASAAIEGRSGWWLLDASPDLPAQIHDQGSMPQGIFLTHAHIGHYTGLMYLGREALGAQSMPVYCSPRMAEFLRKNGPWSQLVALGNIELHEFKTDQAIELEPDLQLTPLAVPHRDEFSDTHGFFIEHLASRREGIPGSLLFLPDIDQWDRWERRIEDFLEPGAHLLLDGTFWSGAELPHRDLSEIPHPLVSQSIELLRDPLAASQASVRFFHLNHSNPLWTRDGPEARRLRAAGFQLAVRGERVPF
jgi:pyrroloquinoline quinone biosynthesis protein B